MARTPVATDELLIVAGEASGDLHAARLLAELRRRRPALRAFGLGGGELVAAGFEAVARAEEISAVGLAEVARVVPRAWQIRNRLLAEVERRRPAAAVLVDFPELNLRLAGPLRRRGVRVVYYISPQLWAWRQGRVRVVRRWVDRMLVLFPFEGDFYERHGVDATVVGHPLVDEVPELPQAWEAGAPPPGEPYRVALLPGSRRSELRRLLPTLLTAAAGLAAELPVRLRLVLAPTLEAADLAPFLAEAAVAPEVVTRDRFATMAASHLALTASGTATLELALTGTPMVVTYRVGVATYLLGRLLVRSRTIALANLLLGRHAVPELVQGEATPAAIRDQALRLLRDPPRVEAMRRDLARVRPLLGRGGASSRAAAEVLSVLAGEEGE